MNHVIEKIGTKVPMYYKDKEIVLEEQWDDVEHVCEGCVLEDVQYCLRKIVPEQKSDVCCPRGTNEVYVFKYKDED